MDKKNGDIQPSLCYDGGNIAEETRGFAPAERSVMPKDAYCDFDNLPELIPVKLAARVLNVSVKTLYDWKYRGQVRQTRIPPDLFAKIGGKLYLRKRVLIFWAFDRRFL